MHTARTDRILAAATAALALAAAASAGDSTSAWYTPCRSTEGFGSFAAHVTYSWMGGSTATLTVDLANDTLASRGGFITALALNGAAGTSMSFVSCTGASFGGLAGPVSAPPFGNFMTGASTSASWLSGGSPSLGIGVGSMETFVFSMTGSSALLSGLTAEDALDGSGYAMAVRFRGGMDPSGWSDKVVGCAMPAPGAVSLLAIAGVAGTRRRRR